MATKNHLTALALILGAGVVAAPVLAQNANGGGVGQQMMQGQGQGQGMGMRGMRGDGPMFDFDGADANSDGKVTKEELSAYRQTLMSGVDANGDGMISVEELSAHMKARMDAKIDERAKARVASQDLNGDGMLSVDELLAPPMATRMFDRLDTDGDGAVSQQEIAQAKAKMQQRRGGDRDGWRGMRDGHGLGERLGQARHNHGMGWFDWNDDN